MQDIQKQQEGSKNASDALSKMMSLENLPPELQGKMQEHLGGMNKASWGELLKHGSHIQKRNMFRITVGGKTYHSLNDLPDEVREQMKESFGFLKDEDNNGVPDMCENGLMGFLKGLFSLNPISILRYQSNLTQKKMHQKQSQGIKHSPAGKTAPALHSLTAQEDRSQKRKLLFLVLAALGLAAYFRWEEIVTWVMEKMV